MRPNLLIRKQFGVGDHFTKKKIRKKTPEKYCKFILCEKHRKNLSMLYFQQMLQMSLFL